MTVDDKLNILDKLDELDELTDEHFLVIKQYVSDDDEFVRSRCAALLVNYSNNESMDLLLTLMKDEDSFVRTEAYDSLAIFNNKTVEQSLHEAIKTETDDLARGYAILSWGDVISGLHCNTKKNINFIKQQKAEEKVSSCILHCCYALYINGQKEFFPEIISFLEDDDYHVRCATLSTLNEIIDINNQEQIKKSVIKMLETEQSIAVRDRAIKLLNSI